MRLKVLRSGVAAALLATSLAGVGSATAAPDPATSSGSGRDAVVEWNGVMVTTVSVLNPFVQARVAAITQLAVFEAVNAITAEYAPYLGSIGAPAGASPEAAAVGAAHAALSHYVPGAAAALDAARATSLASIPDGTAEDAGVAVGQAAAAALIALRATDGSAPPQFHQPASTDPGVWQTTPTCPPAGGILLHWRNMTPFGVASNTQFRSKAPPALTSVQYARDYAEVLRVGAADSLDRPADRADVARLYNVLLAVGAWNGAAQQLAAAQPASLSANARALALLNMAISDGLTSVMETKYHYVLWRPETAIRAGDADGNPATPRDADFVPFIATPCFPSYGSAHASAGGAARAVLDRVWGDAGHSLVLGHPALPTISLRYTSLRQIADDIDDARVYGGIHFRFDQEAGAKQGRQVGQYVYAHNLQAID